MSAWKIGDWAYRGYELVQVKELYKDKVTCVTTGFISMSGNIDEELCPQNIENKIIAQTLATYWDRIRTARGSVGLNHPDLSRRFEDFAYRAMTSTDDERVKIMEAASKFQGDCSEKMDEMTQARVDGTYLFNRNR